MTTRASLARERRLLSRERFTRELLAMAQAEAAELREQLRDRDAQIARWKEDLRTGRLVWTNRRLIKVGGRKTSGPKGGCL